MLWIWIFFNQSIYLEETTVQRNKPQETKSQNKLAWIYIHENIDINNRVRTSEKCPPRIYLPFSKESVGATACDSTSLVWQLLSYEELYLVPRTRIRLRLSHDLCLSRKISGREIAGVWKLATLVTADWSTGDFQRWREMSESDVNTSLY